MRRSVRREAPLHLFLLLPHNCSRSIANGSGSGCRDTPCCAQTRCGLFNYHDVLMIRGHACSLCSLARRNPIRSAVRRRPEQQMLGGLSVTGSFGAFATLPANLMSPVDRGTAQLLNNDQCFHVDALVLCGHCSYRNSSRFFHVGKVHTPCSCLPAHSRFSKRNSKI